MRIITLQSLLAVAALWAYAQAHSAAPVTADTLSLLSVEVVANRATAATPVAHTNVNRAEIERVNTGRDLPYLLSMTPSMVITSDAGAGVGYSAMRVRGTDASRINVTIDGIPVNDAESHRVYWVNMPDLASSLRDVQVQRGAGTSTNGAGAFGASVNMLSGRSASRAYGELSGSYGSYNTHKVTIMAGSGLLGGRWTVDARVSRIGSDGYIDRASSSLWSYMGQVGYSSGATSLRMVAFGGREITYMAWDYASKEDMERYGRRYNPCGRYTAADGSTAYYPDQKDYFTQHNFRIHLNQLLGRGWRLSAALHYTRGIGHYRQYKTSRTLTEYGLQPYVDSLGNVVEKSDIIRLKYSNSHFLGVTAGADWSHGPVHLTLGAAANDYRGHHFGQVEWVRNYSGPLNPLQKYYGNRSDKLDANVFARVNVDVTRTLAAFADVQYRHIDYRLTGTNDNFDYTTGTMQRMHYRERYDFLNPKVGINFTDGRHNRAFASWSVAHKEPTRTNFTDGDPAHLPGAERLFDYELGYAYTHSIFSVGINLYYMDYKDQLVATGQLSDTGNPLSINVPRSYRAGIELQGRVKPCKWFDWQLNATLSRNRIKDFTEYIYDDNYTNPIANRIGTTVIAFSPSFTLNNAFSFTVAGFSATLRSHYVSRQYLTNVRSADVELPAYFVTDLFLGYSFRGIAGLRELRLGVNVNNIFNEQYESNGYSGAGYYLGTDGAPVIYRYAGYAAQAPVNALASMTVKF